MKGKRYRKNCKENKILKFLITIKRFKNVTFMKIDVIKRRDRE